MSRLGVFIAAPSGRDVVVENVWKIFTSARQDEVVAVQDASLTIKASRFISIIGPSGCGKTTLLHLIHGLTRPTKGVVRIGGEEVQHPRETQNLGRAIVFQAPTLLPWKTVQENVLYGMEVGPRAKRKTDPAVLRETADHYIGLTGLKGFKNHYPHELSGGMKQRVNLARALVTNPDLLLMDEPFSALDAQTREIMQEELVKLWEKESRTVVFITHDLEEALFLSDQVVAMSARPGVILEAMDNPLPRPRDLSIKGTDEFIQMKRYLWKILEVEVKKTIGR